MSSFEEAAAQAAAEFAGTNNSTATVAMAAMGGSLLSTLVGGTMSLFGFTSSGIAAGSMAAAVQSTIGDVASGSLFAGFQSFGAIGGYQVLLLGGTIGAVVGSLLFCI